MSKEVILDAEKACRAFEVVKRDIEKNFPYEDEYIGKFFEAMRSLKQSLDEL